MGTWPLVLCAAFAVASPLAGCAGARPEDAPSAVARAPRVEASEGSSRYVPGELPPLRVPLSPTGSGPTEEDRRIFAEANRVRAQNGLPPFRWDDRLFRAAWDHALDQHTHEFMGHSASDPARADLGDRLALAGYRGRTWAEVVAWGYDGPAAVVAGWMASRGHRKILMDPRLADAAFARVGDYFTGDFGSPR